jgi:hypothetical protein
VMARLSPLADTGDSRGDDTDAPPWVPCTTLPTRSCLETGAHGCCRVEMAEEGE